MANSSSDPRREAVVKALIAGLSTAQAETVATAILSVLPTEMLTELEVERIVQEALRKPSRVESRPWWKFSVQTSLFWIVVIISMMLYASNTTEGTIRLLNSTDAYQNKSISALTDRITKLEDAK